MNYVWNRFLNSFNVCFKVHANSFIDFPRGSEQISLLCPCVNRNCTLRSIFVTNKPQRVINIKVQLHLRGEWYCIMYWHSLDGGDLCVFLFSIYIYIFTQYAEDITRPFNLYWGDKTILYLLLFNHKELCKSWRKSKIF